MSLFGKAKSLLGSVFDAAGRFLGSLFQTELEVVDNIDGIVAAFEETKKNIEAEIEKLRTFEFDPHWKTRVINVPKAIDQSRALAEKIIETFTGKLETIVTPIRDFKKVFASEAAPDPLGDKANALAKAGVKIGHIAEMIAELRKAMDVIKNMSAVFKEVTDSLESLDTLFLSQGNAQKRALKDGRFRVRR